MANAAGEKAPGAFKTIGELSQELGVAQHILRYWETKFPQLRPLQRAGNRRYYRPADVDLARTIHRLLNSEGYTVRGVQKVLRSRNSRAADEGAAPVVAAPAEQSPEAVSKLDLDRLLAVRNRLAAAIED
jgi:DNA-binding transcriptional MerR regulator